MLNVILNYKDLTQEKINSIKETYIANSEALNNKLLNIDYNLLTWENLIQPTIDLDNKFIQNAYLEMKSFHTDEELREHITDISTEIEQYGIDNSMRKDIYKIYKFYYENQYQQNKANLTIEQKSYIEDMMINYKKLGLDLSDDKYERVKEIKKEIADLTSQYSLNLDNYDKEFYFKIEDVEGLPESFINDHIDGDQIKVNLKYPDYVPMMEFCKNREIRKQLNYEYKRRAYDTNVKLAEDVFKLRQEQAKLFGVDHHSDYVLEQTMAGSTETVNNFLSKIKSKLNKLLERDMNILKSYATNDNIEKLESWDIAYYSRIHTESVSKLEKEELKKYFPVERTINGVLDLYQILLGYKFKRTNQYDSTLWHDEVVVYEVYEEDSEAYMPQGYRIKGYFYLDLYPREGKYGHAAVFPFISKSSVTIPVAAMACNFAKDYLTFDEFETFLHEFGHVMHHISSVSTISDTAGFACEGDFVETPSQMFEEWCYSSKVLKMISPEITDEIIEKIQQQRKVLQGYQYTRQLLFATMDMHFHSDKFEGNSYDVVKTFTKDLLNLETLEDTNEIASFGHLMDGYDAGYYGYMWSLVYAKDLYTEFKNKEFDPVLGKKLKDEILSKGSIRPSLESVRIFLGREPNEDAFINSLE